MVVVIPILYALSVDCPSVINLAKGLLMNMARPAMMSAIEFDCCDTMATGVTCTPTRVIIIDWNSLGLTGSINGSAIPNALTSFSLSNNGVVGSIPIFPSTVTHINLYINAMTGPLPPFKLDFRDIDYGLNDFFGTLPQMNPGLIRLNLYGVRGIIGGISYFPDTLTILNTGYNLMNGSLPVFPVSLNQFRCFNNMFTGTISITRPSAFIINDNRFTAMSISDISDLGACDIGNNLFSLESVRYLSAKCDMTGLLNASTTVMSNHYSAKTSIGGAVSMTTSGRIGTNPRSITTASAVILTSAGKSIAITYTSLYPFYSVEPPYSETTVASKGFGTATDSSDFASNSTFLQALTSTTSSFETESPSLDADTTTILDPNALVLIYILLGAIFLLFIGLLVARQFVKAPTINSRFARRHSNGTLMTTASNKQKSKV